jgi:hypothetical protein
VDLEPRGGRQFPFNTEGSLVPIGLPFGDLDSGSGETGRCHVDQTRHWNLVWEGLGLLRHQAVSDLPCSVQADDLPERLRSVKRRGNQAQRQRTLENRREKARGFKSGSGFHGLIRK